MLGKTAKYRLCFNFSRNIMEYMNFKRRKKCNHLTNVRCIFANM